MVVHIIEALRRHFPQMVVVSVSPRPMLKPPAQETRRPGAPLRRSGERK